jgi:uncharacterized RDD family membrane protein YckC
MKKLTPIFKRLAAFVIDHTIIMSLLSVIGLIFADRLEASSHTFMDSVKDLWDTVVQFVSRHEPSMLSKITAKFSIYFNHAQYLQYTIIVGIIVAFTYFVFFERSKWQATIGKRLLGLKVANAANKRLSLFQAAKRFVIFGIPAFTFHFFAFFVYHPQCMDVVKLEMELPSPCMKLVIGYVIALLLWLIPIFFTKNKTTTYDMLSKTHIKY